MPYFLYNNICYIKKKSIQITICTFCQPLGSSKKWSDERISSINVVGSCFPIWWVLDEGFEYCRPEIWILHLTSPSSQIPGFRIPRQGQHVSNHIAQLLFP